MPSYPSKDDVEEEVKRYEETVRFFAVFERVLNEGGLHPQIEPTCHKPDGSICTPDFVVEEDDLKTVIDHKASLSKNENNTMDELDDVYNKYIPLVPAGHGQIAALFPKSEESAVQLTIHLLTNPLVLSSFLMMHDSKTLELHTLKGIYLSPNLARIMSDRFRYEFLEFAKYKLIRMKPPVPLAADIIWSYVLLPLYGASDQFDDGATIDYQDILTETSTQMRGYGTDSEESLRGVVNDALRFLDKIGWVEFRKQDEPVKVYARKGKGKGQVRTQFCEKWFELKANVSVTTRTEQKDNTRQTSLEQDNG